MAKAPIALDELIANTPVMGGWQKLPIERLSRVDYRLALGLDNIPQRLLDYHDSASTRDFVFEAGGLLSKHVDQLLTHAESTTVEKVSPVRDASRKINQAFAHGLITQKDKSLLHRVRNVRNRFAHDVDLRHFEADPRVLGWVRSLPCSIENQPASAVPLRLRVLTTALNLHESMSATLARLAGGQLTSETVDLSSRKS